MSGPAPPSWAERDAAPIARELADLVRGMAHRLEGIADSILRGDRLSGFPGRGLEAVGVREYQQGDEARGIDWRVTARTGRLHVKEFDEERDLPFLILVHRSPTLSAGRSGIREVRALEVAALLAAVALKGGDRVGLLQGGEGGGGYRPPARESTRLLHLLAGLLDPPADVFREDLPALLATARRLAVGRHRIFLIGDFQIPREAEGEVREGLGALAVHHALTPVRVVDRGEGVFPGAIPLPFLDPRNRRIHGPGRGRGGKQLREAMDREEERVGEMLREMGFREWRVEVGEPLVPTLKAHMARDRWKGGGHV